MVAGFALGPKGRLRSEAEQERATGSTLEFWRSNKKKQPSGCCSCGGRIRTCDLQVMSLASYQLLHSAMLILPDFAGDFFKSAAKVQLFFELHKYLSLFFGKSTFLELFPTFFLLNSKKKPNFAHCNCNVQSIN